MNNECYIVRDLLPSYIDQLCSEQSEKFINQHMEQCSSCAQMLHLMREEVDQVEPIDLQERNEQKKPFEKISRFLKTQLNFMKYLKASFWISLSIVLILLVFSFSNLSSWIEDQREEQRVEQEQQAIMAEAFAAISAGGTQDERAWQGVFQKYQGKLQHIAVFPAESVEDSETLKEAPSTRFPIDYDNAQLVIGEDGRITETIVPNDYDIGTMVMANDEWVVQFEYEDTYLETVENAFQIKHYSPEAWELFLLPALFAIVTLFILVCWRYQKRAIKPLEYVIA